MANTVPEKVVGKMLENDAFSKWLGIEVVTLGEGHCSLSMTVRKEMLNGFHIAHGGITYSLADSALAFAANSYGRKSVSVETSISHTKPSKEGDVITAKAVEKSISNKIAIYEISITNSTGELIALFKGTVYRTDKEWDV